MLTATDKRKCSKNVVKQISAVFVMFLAGQNKLKKYSGIRIK